MGPEMPGSSQPKKPYGDELARVREREQNKEPGDVAAEELRFVELMRAGHADDQIAQQRLFASLKSAVGSESAVTRMNKLLESARMRGAVVPVESSTVAADGTPALTPVTTEKERWVSWKRVFRDRTPSEQAFLRLQNRDPQEQVEIPGSIEKILQIKLGNESVDESIAAGHYLRDYISGQLTAEDRSLPSLAVETDLLLPKFDGSVSSDWVDKWLEDNDLRGSTLQELLVMAVQFPEEQRRVWLVALAATWLSRRRLPLLYFTNDGERNIGVVARDTRWDETFRFPAVRKEKNSPL